MLASPLYPPATFREDHDTTQYRPAKDIDAFNKLLPPPVEFVEGSSTGTLALGDGKYLPINAPSPAKPSKPEGKSADSSNDAQSTPRSAQSSLATEKSLYSKTIETTWPPNTHMGVGLNNTGNTCFLNSALQCLLHTPPLLRVLIAHNKHDPCRVKKGAFCMSCSLRNLMIESYKKQRSLTPYQITTNLQHIAKHMRRGRQEDSHEFLRYAIDALQKSCLAGYPPKMDHKVAETTWVHKIFGGKLRSRVTCLSCGHNSDTFDSILDLSVDIYGMHSLTEALRKFVAVDHLKGSDKYKCEKCKKHVNADKQFTLNEAPAVLSIHLKRFSPMGRKLSQPIRYDEKISLKSIMSEGSFGPMYTLYGVISHAGGGPNSGHYYAHVKNSHGEWFEMNDDYVSKSSTPTTMKNAYILFYIREKGQALEAAVSSASSQRSVSTPPPAPPLKKASVVSSMKKRKIVESEDEDITPATPSSNVPFIGPRLPSPPPPSSSIIDRSTTPPDAKKQKPNAPDPQSEKLKKKIAAYSKPSPSNALLSLSQYTDDSDDDMGEKVEQAPAVPSKDEEGPASEPSLPPQTPSSASQEPASSVTKSSPAAPVTVNGFTPVPASSFYGSASSKGKGKDRGGFNEKKRKSSDDSDSDDERVRLWAKTPISPVPSSTSGSYRGLNPYSRLKGSNNLSERRDGDRFARGKRKKSFLM